MSLKYKKIVWHIYQGALISDVPPHINVNLSLDDEQYLLKKSGAYFLRYTTDWDCDKTDFWYVIKDSFGGIEELGRNMRNQVRKGLKNCVVRKIGEAEMQTHAYEVYKEAFKLYDTFIVPISKNDFQKQIDGDKYEYWGVYINDILVTYGQNSIKDGHCEYNVVKIHPDYIRQYPSYALFYEMNKYYLQEKGMSYVCDGARSISHQTNIQNFLIQKFKFRKAYCRLHVVYRKDIGILVKFLFPFNGLLKKIKLKPVEKLVVLLRHEEIRRNCEK